MEFKEYVELAKIFGPLGTLGLYFLWERVINPHRKKKKGTFITWKAMKETLDEYAIEQKKVNKEVGDLRRILDSKIEKELEKDRRVDLLQTKQDAQAGTIREWGYILRDLGDNLKTNNRLLGQVKDALENRGEGHNGGSA
jgi:hypothetical protein